MSSLKSINKRKTHWQGESNVEELSDQKKKEIRLIAELTFEATLSVEAKLSKLTGTTATNHYNKQ
jgi:hypothetical protein